MRRNGENMIEGRITMILAIDIGNTNVTIGAFEGEECIFVSRLFTDKSKTADEYACDFCNIFALNNVKGSVFSGCVISNVVPEIASAVEEACEKVTGKTPVVLGPGVKTGLNILSDDPAQLGADIVAGCVAAKEKYPVPSIVIDLGTATKITALDKNGSFVGTVISCGVRVALDALAGNASLLTSVKLKAPKHVIGKNTIDCMQSGAVYGTAAMLDGMIERFEDELDEPVKAIVATGGYAKNIVSNCKNEVTYDPTLVLDGLRMIYEKNKK